jgi:hypothetical protein
MLVANCRHVLPFVNYTVPAVGQSSSLPAQPTLTPALLVSLVKLTVLFIGFASLHNITLICPLLQS